MNDLNIVAKFIDHKCARLPGGRARFSDLYAAFIRELPEEDRTAWSLRRFGAVLESLNLHRGKAPSGRVEVANLAMVNQMCEVRDGKLIVTPI